MSIRKEDSKFFKFLIYFERYQHRNILGKFKSKILQKNHGLSSS